MFKNNDVSLIEIIVTIAIAAILGLLITGVIINESHKISHGTVVDKQYRAAYSTVNHSKNGNYSVYHPESCKLTIQGEKNGETVEYTFEVPESEYAMYNIGDNYPKE